MHTALISCFLCISQPSTQEDDNKITFKCPLLPSRVHTEKDVHLQPNFLSPAHICPIEIWNTHILFMTAIILSTGTKFVNKEEIVSGTREGSVTLRLSSLRVFTGKMYSFFCLGYLFLLFIKKNNFCLHCY